MKAENKTKETQADVAAFLNKIEDAQKRADSIRIAEIMEEVSGFPPKMWGPAIVGFGTYHFKYDSGREGDFLIVGFSPRKAEISLYLGTDFEDRDALLAQLGKHKTAKSCIYVKKMADINEEALRELIRRSVARKK